MCRATFEGLGEYDQAAKAAHNLTSLLNSFGIPQLVCASDWIPPSLPRDRLPFGLVAAFLIAWDS
jgi:hypothetical protein